MIFNVLSTMHDCLVNRNCFRSTVLWALVIVGSPSVCLRALGIVGQPYALPSGRVMAIKQLGSSQTLRLYDYNVTSQQWGWTTVASLGVGRTYDDIRRIAKNKYLLTGKHGLVNTFTIVSGSTVTHHIGEFRLLESGRLQGSDYLGQFNFPPIVMTAYYDTVGTIGPFSNFFTTGLLDAAMISSGELVYFHPGMDKFVRVNIQKANTGAYTYASFGIPSIPPKGIQAQTLGAGGSGSVFYYSAGIDPYLMRAYTTGVTLKHLKIPPPPGVSLLFKPVRVTPNVVAVAGVNISNAFYYGVYTYNISLKKWFLVKKLSAWFGSPLQTDGSALAVGYITFLDGVTIWQLRVQDNGKVAQKLTLPPP